MHEHMAAQPLTDNVIDKAASSANKAVDATKNAASAALDSVSDKVESMRSTLSPALDNAMAPLDAVVNYTRAQPIKALVVAVVAGALLSAVLGPSRRARR